MQAQSVHPDFSEGVDREVLNTVLSRLGAMDLALHGRKTFAVYQRKAGKVESICPRSRAALTYLWRSPWWMPLRYT